MVVEGRADAAGGPNTAREMVRAGYLFRFVSQSAVATTGQVTRS